MNLKLHKSLSISGGTINLPGSKSISNRFLIIKALSEINFGVKNLSDSDDTDHLMEALFNSSKSLVIDVGHAGTDMRFLTAFLSLKNETYELTGSTRLQKRPIKNLVDVLRTLGADIIYKSQEGYPPLQISGKQLDGGMVEINGDVSSQFITALLLVAPYFTNGLELTIKGELVSKPYVNMTIEIMREFGAIVNWENAKIKVQPASYNYLKNEFIVESDWSAASYYYSLVALSDVGTTLNLQGLFRKSLQADSVCANIFENFGVQTHYFSDHIQIIKTKRVDQFFRYNFIECPDIAQTLVCTCIGLGYPFYFTGLQTLKVKETDRIIALQNECRKFGVELAITQNSIEWNGQQKLNSSQAISVNTYNDHRMAMSFAALSLVCEEIIIEDADVVSKSYPLFWEHLSQVGITSV